MQRDRERCIVAQQPSAEPGLLSTNLETKLTARNSEGGVSSLREVREDLESAGVGVRLEVGDRGVLLVASRDV